MRDREGGVRTLFLLAFTLLAFTGLTGCGSTAAAYNAVLSLPLYGREMHDPGVLDPAQESPQTPIEYASLTQAGLVELGPDLHVIPDLAVSLPTMSVPDGRSYTFTIRQDAHFADGKPCTAWDVAYSLARALRFGAPLARQYLGEIVGARPVEAGQTWHLSGVTVLQRLTVRIRLRTPDNTFLTKLAYPLASIVEPSRVPGIPRGLGPFEPDRGTFGGMLTLRPRPRFTGVPQIHEVRLVPVSSYARGLQLYHAGGLDAAQVPFSDYNSVSQRTDFYSSPALDAFYAVPHGNDAALRAAINPDTLATDVGYAVDPLSGIVPPAVPDYQSSTLSATPTGATAASRVDLTLADPTDPELRAVRAALERQIAVSPSGRHITLEHVWRMLADPTRWLSLSPDVTRSHWYSSVVRQGMRMTFDQVDRMGLYQSAEAWTVQRGAIVPLLSGRVGYLVKSSLENVEVTPEGLMPANADWTQVSLNPGQ